MTGNADVTARFYGGLQSAYESFNRDLFQSELPGCLVTLQRRRGVFGYYSPGRFGDPALKGAGASAAAEAAVDEIALNPCYFLDRTPEEALSTLAHEMAHLWQHHRGTAPSGGYHNREWAEKMRSVGLIPSDTGKEGGRSTGRRMSHYIDPHGSFAAVCAAFLRDGPGLTLYYDRAGDGSRPSRKPANPAAKPVSYKCGGCGRAARAHAGLPLWCGACKKPMTMKVRP